MYCAAYGHCTWVRHLEFEYNNCSVILAETTTYNVMIIIELFNDCNSPLDIFSVTKIVSLRVFLGVEQDHDGSHEVDHLTGRKQVQVGPGILASIAVDPLQLRLLVWGRGHLGQRVGLDHRGWGVELELG